ncbi:MAG: integrase core domain-containing protein [Planctomycetota bacterium]|nr:integrase core domain-containing protein [Planctomycetota bacterium]
MARENERWGYNRIQGALANIGHQVSRSAIRRTLKEHGIEPSPERGKRTSWKKFLKAHWGTIAAADFLTVEVWTFRGLTRFYVFFVIDLATRRVQIAGISATPNGNWSEQMARNLADPFDGYLRIHQYLITDRDPLYTQAFRNIFRSSGVTVVRLPPRSPDLNAYAERFVRSIKSECLSRMIFFGERHLRTTIGEYMEHYHLERNHQGLKNRLVAPAHVAGQLSGTVDRRERLGGMLNYYYRRAA